MTSSADLFDRALLAQRRGRAAARFCKHDFLLARAAEDLVERLGAVVRDFPRALDIGSHDGCLSRALSGCSNVERVIRADASPRMLALGSGSAVACHEDLLPFAEQSFDLVASALSLHWVNDLPGALVQVRKCLKPDGLFLASLLGGETLSELSQSLMASEIELSGGGSPRVGPFADVRTLGALLQRAGFALPVADMDRITVTYETPFALMGELRAMGAANVLKDRSRLPLRRAVLMRAAEIYQERFADERGRVPATFEIVTLTGWSPSADQPKPLQPGSAKMRLADALGVAEKSTGEAAIPRSDDKSDER